MLCQNRINIKKLQTTVCLLVFVALGTRAAFGSMWMPLSGKITVTAKQAPIRSEYPDGRIVAVAAQGQVLTVAGLAADQSGSWVSVSYKQGNDTIRGFVDSDLTSFEKEMNAGHLKSPQN